MKWQDSGDGSGYIQLVDWGYRVHAIQEYASRKKKTWHCCMKKWTLHVDEEIEAITPPLTSCNYKDTYHVCAMCQDEKEVWKSRTYTPTASSHGEHELDAWHISLVRIPTVKRDQNVRLKEASSFYWTKWKKVLPKYKGDQPSYKCRHGELSSRSSCMGKKRKNGRITIHILYWIL